METKLKWVDYFQFLDELRKSGETNMFGATRYLMDEYPDLDKWSAKKITIAWMKTFSAKPVEERVKDIEKFD